MAAARRPLLPVAAAFGGGVFLADLADPVPGAAAAFALLGAAAVWTLLRAPGALAGLAASAAALAAGFLVGRSAFDRSGLPPVLTERGSEKRLVSLRGFLADEPVPGTTGPSDVGPQGQPILFGELSAESIRGPRGFEPCAGLVRFRVEHPPAGLHIGDRVEMVGHLAVPPPPSNPGQWDYGRHLRRRGIAGRVLIADGSLVRLLAPDPGGGPVKGLRRLRTQLGRAIARDFPPGRAGFLRSLLLGGREEFDRELRDAFARTGTIHYIAISGFHFLVLLWVVTYADRVFPIPHRALALLQIGLGVCYAVLVGAQPSVVRAVAMSSVFAAGPLFRRIPDSTNSLALAFVICLALEPGGLWNPGFQLSFAAVAGLLYLYPRLFSALPLPPPDPLVPPGRIRRGVRRIGDGVRKGLLVTLSAWIFTMPIVAFHFHLVSPVTFLANLAIFWPITLALILGFAYLPLAALWPGAAALLAPPTVLLIDATEALVRFFAAFPCSAFHVAGPGPGWLLAHYLGLALLLRWTAAPFSLFGRVLALRPQRAILAYLALLVAYLGAGAFPGRGERLSFLDVGHGLAVVGETRGRTFLYDAGSGTASRVGERVVAPFLWSRRVPRLDAVFLSHPDRDHVSGVLEMVERFSCGAVFVSPYFDAGETGRRLLGEIRARGVEIVRLGEGDRIEIPGASIEAVHPPAGAPAGLFSSNDGSLTLEVAAAGRRFLLTGDLEEIGLAHLYRGRSSCGVFQVPHHGRGVADAEAIAARFRPGLAVVSAEAGGFDPLVLSAFGRAGARVVVTGEEGAVTVERAAVRRFLREGE